MHVWETKHMGGVQEANRSMRGWRSDRDAPRSNGARLERKQAFPSKSCELPNELELEELQEFILQVESAPNLANNYDNSKRVLADTQMVRGSRRKESNDTGPNQ